MRWSVQFRQSGKVVVDGWMGLRRWMDVGVGGRRVGMIWRHRERGLEEAVSSVAQPRAGTSSQWAPPRHICSCTGAGQPAGDPARATARAPGSHRGGQSATGPRRRPQGPIGAKQCTVSPPGQYDLATSERQWRHLLLASPAPRTVSERAARTYRSRRGIGARHRRRERIRGVLAAYKHSTRTRRLSSCWS